MNLSKVEQIVYDIAQPEASALGLYVYDVEYVKEGAFWFLRVFVDKEDCGASLDDCEAVSRAIGKVLDAKDLIAQNYYLEVATPGIDRKLKHEEHFARYVGREVEIGLFKPLDGTKQITGTLVGYDKGVITVNYENTNIQLNQKDTTRVRLAFDFSELGGNDKK